VKTIFTEVKDVGDNYMIGIIPISNLSGNTEVHLYADTAGWLVAYLTRDEPAAKIMKWPENYNYSPITRITTTTLREALRNAGKATGVGVPHEIKYYDFRSPDANMMTLFVKEGLHGGITQVKIPANYMLYEASYYHSGSGQLVVDGTVISQTSQYRYRIIDTYKGAITVGSLHTIRATNSVVATVLIYRTN
jgi:hypothetical protein